MTDLSDEEDMTFQAYSLGERCDDNDEWSPRAVKAHANRAVSPEVWDTEDLEKTPQERIDELESEEEPHVGARVEALWKYILEEGGEDCYEAPYIDADVLRGAEKRLNLKFVYAEMPTAVDVAEGAYWLDHWGRCPFARYIVEWLYEHWPRYWNKEPSEFEIAETLQLL